MSPQPTETHPVSRPTLLPGLRPLWRDPHTVQLGTDPTQAVVLELPHPAAGKLLELLDGAHTVSAIVVQMGRIGMPVEDVEAVLAALGEAGLVVAAHTLMPSALPADHRQRVAAEATALALRFRDRATTPAAILRRRHAARVIIAGTGPFASLLTSALHAAGVGTIGHVTEPGAAATLISPSATPFTPPTPANPPREAGAPLRAPTPNPTTGPSAYASASSTPGRPAPGGAASTPRKATHRGAAKGDQEIDSATASTPPPQAAHPAGAQGEQAAGGKSAGRAGKGSRAKTVRVEEAFVVQIGRMGRVALRGARQRLPHLAITVRDGVAIVGPLVPASGGPCLRCLDLHRADRDPAWPRLAAQLAEWQEEPMPCAAATVLTAAGLATAEILAYLDGGEPSTIGTTVEINGAQPWRRRSWMPHNACDCTRRR